MIDTRTVSSVAVHAGDYADMLTLYDTVSQPIILDDRAGACTFRIGDRAVERWELLRWLPTVRDVTVELDRDPQRYMQVTAARFTGKAK